MDVETQPVHLSMSHTYMVNTVTHNQICNNMGGGELRRKHLKKIVDKIVTSQSKAEAERSFILFTMTITLAKLCPNLTRASKHTATEKLENH